MNIKMTLVLEGFCIQYIVCSTCMFTSLDPLSIKYLPLSVFTVYIFVICPCTPQNIQYIVLSTEFAFFFVIFPSDPLLLLIYCLIYFSLCVGALCLSLFCYALLCVHSCFAIIWKRNRKLVVLLYCLTDILLL